MRPFVGGVLIAMLSIIACLDPLWFADRCDQAGVATAHSVEPGVDCPNCLAAVVSRVATDLIRLEMTRPLGESAAPAPIADIPADVDHPPRTA